MARLREKSESLMAENTELKEEIKLLEKQRLQTWQQREHAPKVWGSGHICIIVWRVGVRQRALVGPVPKPSHRN